MKNSVKKMQFIKMHGLGNDYIYVDCFDPNTADLIAQTELPSLARRVSDRHFGIGSDGLVLILPSDEADAGNSAVLPPCRAGKQGAHPH